MFQTKPIKKQLKNGQQPTKIIRKKYDKTKKKVRSAKELQKKIKT